MINQELEDQRNNKHPMYFINIVDCILRYYKMHPHVEPGDEWKSKSGMFIEHSVPDDLDKLIKKGFKNELEQYCK